ncbi:hypothetical protein [Moritella sp.]|uniref:hypothetical protein n=1 Tax=Moritella sp. TaxID=78556 RepID=UPI001D3C8589|nr:hypothetical protein [Moritella sp.]MCJ8349010.1 hypothetical protein [Moritella sp.]NQZ41385.1 hypothetical protein [Moritella sp.]
MNKHIIAAILCMGIALGMYGLNFHTYQISDDVNDWGQFGGYVGGILTPILTFLSYIMLVKSLSLQNETNAALREESNLNVKNEKIRSFEVHFFNLIDAQRDTFEHFKLEFDKDKFVSSVSAVRELEDRIEYMRDNNSNDIALTEFIKQVDSHEKIYNTQRVFYVITRMISLKLSDENGFTREDRMVQLTTLVNFTELSILRIVLISMQFLSYKSSKLLRDNDEMLDVLKDLKLPLDQY